MNRNILLLYYAATAVFVSLDFGYDINVRVAFLQGTPGLRAGYYVLLFGCFALMLWRPAWSVLIGVVESGAMLIVLIMNIAMRSMVVTDAMLETGAGVVTIPEVVNFIIAGGAAYIAYVQGVNRLTSRSGRD